MNSQHAEYTVKAVSRLTGLSGATIRAWERRYEAIVPRRSHAGHRRYGPAEVERLLLLSRAIAGGSAIGQVARLGNETLRDLATTEPRALEMPALFGPALILAAIQRFDPNTAERELRRLSVLLPPRRLVYEVALPLIDALEEGWQSGRVGVAQEHLATALLRGLLGTLLGLLEPRSARRPLLLATLPGELHELGLLCVSLAAAWRGVATLYLGVQVPVSEIAVAARASRARAVGLGMAMVTDEAGTLVALKELAAALPPHLAIWLGGGGALTLPSAGLPATCRVFATLQDVELALEARGGPG